MTLPLQGQRILVTRAADQAEALSQQLRALGATVWEAAAIALAPPADWGAVDRAIAGLAETDWVAFTSPNGARLFLDRMAALGAGWPARARVAAVGPGTAEVLTARGRSVALLPARYDGAGLAEALIAAAPMAGTRVLLPRGSLAAKDLPAMLAAAGAEVREVEAYRTVPKAIAPDVAERLQAGVFDWVVFMSGSAFRSLAAAAPEALNRVRLASVGPRTSAVMREQGFEVALEAEESTVEGLVQALARVSSPPGRA